jgi:hypothetical protein
MPIFWAPDEDNAPRNGPWPPQAFADEIAGWIDERAVDRTATAIRALRHRIAEAVPGVSWRRSAEGALRPVIRRRVT